MLMEEMKRSGVKNPNQLLASRNVALVMVRGVLRPGIQKGDHFDVELRIPTRSETVVLRGGHLLETRLKDMAVLQDDRLHSGKPRHWPKGPCWSSTATEKADGALLGRGRVLGGGLALESRALGLYLDCGDETKMDTEQLRNATVTASRVAVVINRRFHHFQDGMKIGVATAKTGKYVDLAVDPRYKDNIERYLRVVRAVAMQESAPQMNQPPALASSS